MGVVMGEESEEGAPAAAELSLDGARERRAARTGSTIMINPIGMIGINVSTWRILHLYLRIRGYTCMSCRTGAGTGSDAAPQVAVGFATEPDTGSEVVGESRGDGPGGGGWCVIMVAGFGDSDGSRSAALFLVARTSSYELKKYEKSPQMSHERAASQMTLSVCVRAGGRSAGMRAGMGVGVRAHMSCRRAGDLRFEAAWRYRGCVALEPNPSVQIGLVFAARVGVGQMENRQNPLYLAFVAREGQRFENERNAASREGVGGVDRRKSLSVSHLERERGVVVGKFP
ncbi:hypothetical protein BJV78DRAFT_1354882 [Lactifluus subvellereus]|nr:hypothetical protein BJV78DRAFT_1354882 [Lactifluus subvellereus]